MLKLPLWASSERGEAISHDTPLIITYVEDSKVSRSHIWVTDIVISV